MNFFEGPKYGESQKLIGGIVGDDPAAKKPQHLNFSPKQASIHN
jgi:hypothetical protein